MIAFPNCKINLGLNVIRKRSDGYHDIETVFYPLPLTDILEVIHAEAVGKDHGKPKTNGTSGVNFIASGEKIPGNSSDNLCIKAYHLVQKDFPDLPPIQLFLHKAIPIGAGLGGGSSDAAFTLKLLNDKFQLKIPSEKLLDYALQLGSDCPFFILNKPCVGTGRGEFLQAIPLDLTGYYFVLVNPGIHISTRWAFESLTFSESIPRISQAIQEPIGNWKHRLKNIFEGPVFSEYPVLNTVKQQLYEAGAIYASLSGSGSCLYGIFDSPPTVVFEGMSTYLLKPKR